MTTQSTASLKPVKDVTVRYLSGQIEVFELLRDARPDGTGRSDYTQVIGDVLYLHLVTRGTREAIPLERVHRWTEEARGA